MVSLKSLLTTSTILLSTAVHALPTNPSTSTLTIRDDTICGVQAAPGIKSPANGTTITISKATQDAYDGVTFEVIYCSGQYFKTSSLYGDIWLSSSAAGLGSAGNGGSYGAEGLALNVKPDSSTAPAGYYGYKTNVTVYPISGNYPSGVRTLSFYEVETGYYNANNIEVHSVQINFKKAAK